MILEVLKHPQACILAADIHRQVPLQFLPRLRVGIAAHLPERLQVRPLDVAQLREEVIDTRPPGHRHGVSLPCRSRRWRSSSWARSTRRSARILRASSTRVMTGTHGVPSTSTRVTIGVELLADDRVVALRVYILVQRSEVLGAVHLDDDLLAFDDAAICPDGSYANGGAAVGIRQVLLGLGQRAGGGGAHGSTVGSQDAGQRSVIR